MDGSWDNHTKRNKSKIENHMISWHTQMKGTDKEKRTQGKR